MFDRELFQHFCLGFFSVFRFGGIPIKGSEPLEIIEYFCQIEDDINKSYEELKKIYEGN